MLFWIVALSFSAFTAAQIANCDVLVPDIPAELGSFCQNCEDGFLNTGTECVPCETENCKVCQPPDAEICTQCVYPYTLVEGECLFLICGEESAGGPDLSAPCGPNCITCPEDDEPFCQECEVGFWNDNGYCKECCIEGCVVCQPPAGLVCT
jgi:hypothetical protein